MIIYKLTCLSENKSYVGQTRRLVETRISEHFNTCKDSNTKLALAMQKYGRDDWELTILEECNDLDTLDEREMHWIAELDTYANGYNMTYGGSWVRQEVRSPEHCQKISKAKLQLSLEGRLPCQQPDWQRKHSERLMGHAPTNVQTYRVLHFDGKEERITNLREYGRTRGIPFPTLSDVAYNKAKSKKWGILAIEPI